MARCSLRTLEKLLEHFYDGRSYDVAALQSLPLDGRPRALRASYAVLDLYAAGS